MRIGWLVGSKETIEKMWSYHDYTSIASGILSNRIATSVLQPEMRLKVLNRNRKILRDNLIILTEWVKKHKDLLYFILPQAGGIVFMKYNIEINSMELTTRLREEKSTFIVAGDCFGMDHYIRIGIGSEKEYLQEGFQLIDTILKEFM